MTDNSFWDSFSSGFSSFTDGVSDFFNVGSTISPSSNMNGDDVLKTKSALNAVGSYQPPSFGITDIPDNSMIDGLKKFQANNGLKVDGVMKPGGPTENALGQTLENQGISPNDLFEKAKAASTPEPDIDADNPQTSWSASASFKDGSITNLSQPKPNKPPLPKIDPMTGLVDPLASAPKGKMPTAKQWEEAKKLQEQKTAPLTYTVTDNDQIKSPLAQSVLPASEQEESTLQAEEDNFRKYREKLAPREGGIANRPTNEDKGGLTNQGMSQRQLDAFRKQDKWKHMPESVRDLSKEQIDQIFKDEYYLRPKLDQLEKIPGLTKESPRFVEQLFDANILHGTDNPGKWLQQAIEQEMGIDLRTKNPETGQMEYDGIIGPKTRAAVEQAVKSGKIQSINNRISATRMNYVTEDEHVKPYLEHNRGWIDRINTFIQK